MRTAARALVLALLGSALGACASDPSTPSGGYYLEQARSLRESGDYDRALEYTQRALAQDPESPRAEVLSLHPAVLRSLDRQREANAFAEFVERYEAGAHTDATDTIPTRSECMDLARTRAKTTRLVREYGDVTVGSFKIGTVAATFEIDAQGRPDRIHVVRARHPAAAWLIVDAIAAAKIRKTRLARIAPEEFPVPHCAWWDFEAAHRPIWLPTRMRR